MNTDTPFFTICVPTRNRNETLFYCLKTLLDQDFESYEVIVSDNSDDEESKQTLAILEELNDDKIKYHRPTSILSMTDNYEFALSKASGRYIICIGDDDGLVINSLKYVFNFIREHNADVVKCPRIGYGWIGSLWDPNSIMAYPLERPIIQVNSKSMLKKVANFEIRYSDLPMIYYSFIKRDLIDDVVKEKGSFFQNSASIDMYSGFVIAYKTENYFITDKPFVILGSSAKSNGALGMVNPNHSIVKEYLQKHNMIMYYEKYKIPVFQKLVLSTFVWLEMLKFKENYALDNKAFNINYRNLLVNMVSTNQLFEKSTTLGMAKDFEQYEIYKEDLKRLKDLFIDRNVFYPNFSNEHTEFCQHATIDPRLFGIKDIYGASLICRKLLDSKDTGIPISISEDLLQEYNKQKLKVSEESIGSLLKKIVRKLIS